MGCLGSFIGMVFGLIGTILAVVFGIVGSVLGIVGSVFGVIIPLILMGIPLLILIAVVGFVYFIFKGDKKNRAVKRYDSPTPTEVDEWEEDQPSVDVQNWKDIPKSESDDDHAK